MMGCFAANLLLALLWGVWKGFSAEALAVGFLTGFLCLSLLVPAPGARRYGRQVLLGLGLAAFYVWELAVSSVRVAIDVLRPRLRMEPAVVGVPLDARTDVEITVLTNLISLTPGTLGLEVSPDRRTLYVHAMHLEDGDPERLRQTLKQQFERRVLRVFRG
jgi:multicomponent Na+:H+ antiporter subunit E